MGLRLLTLSEHYGIPADEEVADAEWLELAGVGGWAVLTRHRRGPTGTVHSPTTRTTRIERLALRGVNSSLHPKFLWNLNQQ